MPCTLQKWEVEFEERRQAAYEEGERLYQPYLDRMARMLCKTCKALEENDIEIPHGVKGWWKDHKRHDANT